MRSALLQASTLIVSQSFSRAHVESKIASELQVQTAFIDDIATATSPNLYR